MDFKKVTINETIPIKKGWSFDDKYKVISSQDEPYLLKVSDKKNLISKQRLFTLLLELREKGLPIPEPIEIGVSKGKVYTLLSWMEGKDLEERFRLMEPIDKYRLGQTAGRILKEIHTVTPHESKSWYEIYEPKIDQKVNDYFDLNIPYEHEKEFLEFILKNRDKIKHRPVSYQHGDYHIGNMVINDKDQLQIIDFDRFDIGDPWEEFNRIDFSAAASREFASGQINAYFDNQVPMEFFTMMALYMAVNAISSLPWGYRYSKLEYYTMIEKANTIYDWYDGFNTVIPSWYIHP